MFKKKVGFVNFNGTHKNAVVLQFAKVSTAQLCIIVINFNFFYHFAIFNLRANPLLIHGNAAHLMKKEYWIKNPKISEVRNFF